jgi:hypothetical protein
MIFEFDPNENINRSEDGNDPQDTGSLGGEGGLFGRVPGRSQVGTANRSQEQAQRGQPISDQGLPFGRQGQAQAHGGLGQARGGPVPRSAGQAPGLLQGMLGRVPSQVSLAASAASASVIPTSGYFGSQKRLAFEINARRVICPKNARGAHGSQDYARHQEAATKAIPYPFALAFMLKTQKGKPQTSMLTSSPNTQGILQRSRPSSGVWTPGT